MKVEMEKSESMIALAPILNLPPVEKKQMEPHALSRYLSLLKDIYDEVPVDELCEEDLTEEEKVRRKRTTDKIVDWVGSSGKDSSLAALMVYPYSGIISGNIMDLKNILKTAYDRKLDKRQHQAMKETRMKALQDVNPPVDDVERYLTADEQDSFINSVPGAVDAYLHGGKGCPLNDWRFDIRAYDYIRWTRTIEERKEEETLFKKAKKDFAIFVEDTNEAIEKSKERLAREKKPGFAYPQPLAKCSPGRWCELNAPTTGEVEAWAVPYMWKRVPLIIKHMVSWHLTWWLLWLPRARYEFLGVPSLVWCFQAKVLAKLDLTISERTFTRNFSGSDCSIEVQAQDLGSIYLGPVEWGDEQEGFTTPVALLGMLAEGKLEGDGIELIEHDKSVLVFAVRGFDKKYAEIHEGFRKFIIDTAKDNSLAEGLLTKGLVDEITSQLLAEKVLLPLPVGKTQNDGVQFKGDGEDLIATLQVMGYQTQKIKEAMESADLSPTMPFEKKVAAVIEILDKNTQ